MIIKTTIRLTYNNKFIETSALKDGSQAINAINAINPFDSSGNIRLTYNNKFIYMPSLKYDSQATAVASPGSVSADQLKNEGQQNFQDGTTSVYMHVDQKFDKVGLIKGYTRTITFPSAIFKPADPKNIKQIKVN